MTDLHCHICPDSTTAPRIWTCRGICCAANALQGCGGSLLPRISILNARIWTSSAGGGMPRWAELVQCYPELTSQLELKKGAEVFFSPSLLETDPRPLCLEGTGLMLVELPVTYRPQWTVDVLYQLGAMGITPLIAHVERYPYVMENPSLLVDWIEAGAYTHVNASSLVLHKRRKVQILKMIRHGLVHFVCTDAHSPDKRPPLLGEAMELIQSRCGEQKARQMGEIALGLWSGEQPISRSRFPCAGCSADGFKSRKRGPHRRWRKRKRAARA